jgi:uncharacterized protein
MTRFKIFITACLIILVGCGGMSTQKKHFTGLNEKLRIRDYTASISQIEGARDTGYRQKDRVQYYLDIGMLYHFNKEYSKSNEMLTKAENAIDELYTKSISKAAASMLLNDNVMEYSGEDYEDIYLNLFKALNYVQLLEFDEAMVEIRRINNKLLLLEDKHKKMANNLNMFKKKKAKFQANRNQFHNSALARYISLLLYRADDHDDDARIDLEKLREAWKQQSHIYNFSMPAVNNLLTKTEKGKVDFLVFTGRCPDKKTDTWYIHTEKDLLIIAETEENPRGNQQLEEFDAIPWDGIKKGYHFKFQLPYLKEQPSQIGKVRILADDVPVQELRMIEDLERVALETYKIKKPLVYLKTITRTILKGILAEKAKAKLDEQVGGGFAGILARAAADMAVDATENADLRISRFFPGKALMGEIELEPGLHNIKIEYYNKSGTLLHVDDKGDFEVLCDDLNLIESYYLY